jgi:CCR4-NOT complex subunit CAF16
MSAIDLEGVGYSFGNNVVLDKITFSVPFRSRILLVGANGAGKSTLLMVLSGKRMTSVGNVRIFDKDPFKEVSQGVTYLGTEWANNPIIRRDMSVAHLVASVGGDYYSERRDLLLELLDVDLEWHMHTISDGERRRVQLIMGLLAPWKLLLLDEVTTDLDVLVRSNLLDFLARETQERDCAIVYATHIFDGLTKWPTHVVRLHLGRVLICSTLEDLQLQPSKDGNSALYELGLEWLRKDKEDRGKRGSENRVKWDDIDDHVKLGQNREKFGAYFRLTRGL